VIKVDRLSLAPDCVFFHIAQWLTEKEMLSVMHSSKRRQFLVNQYLARRFCVISGGGSIAAPQKVEL